MRLTTKARYGLKICLVLGVSYNDDYMSVFDIASRCGYSQKYTEKIIRPLRKHGIVKSTRGAGGGYKLAEAPSFLSVGKIIRALENNLEFIDCIASDCESRNLCPTHEVWKRLYEGINELLDSMMLSEIIEDYHKLIKGADLSEKNYLSG